jgi:hypothetical protein
MSGTDKKTDCCYICEDTALVKLFLDIYESAKAK